MGAGFSSLYRGLSVYRYNETLFIYHYLINREILQTLLLICSLSSWVLFLRRKYITSSQFTNLFISGKSLIHKVFTLELADSEFSENSLVPKMAI